MLSSTSTLPSEASKQSFNTNITTYPNAGSQMLYRTRSHHYQTQVKDDSDTEVRPPDSADSATAPASSSLQISIANRSLDSSERGRKPRSSTGSDASPSRPANLSTSNKTKILPISHHCSHTIFKGTYETPKPIHESQNGVGFKTAPHHLSPHPPRNQEEEPPVFPFDSPADTDVQLGAIHHHYRGNDVKAAPLLSSPHLPWSERGETAASLLANPENTKEHLKNMHEHHEGKKFKAMHCRPTDYSAPGEESQRSLVSKRPASPVISTSPRTKGNRGRQEGSQHSSSSAMEKAPTEFIFFPKLPTEIRLMIWDLALPGPRVIEILCEKNDGRDFCTKSTIPILLHVNRESRALALKVFQRFRAQKSISRDTAQFIHNSIETHEHLIEDSYDGTVIERGAKYESKPVRTYMNYQKDLLYVSLGKYPRRGSSYASKINDFLVDVDEDDAAEIRKIALEPPHNPFNEILQTLSTKFFNLKTCGGVTSDPCAVHPDPDALRQWNLAPHSQAVGFEEVQLEPGNTYKSRRYNSRTGEVEEVDTNLTVEKFEERTAELRKAAKLMGIDEGWIDNLEFPALEIERTPL